MRTLCPEVTREQPPALSDKLNGRLDFLGQHKRKPEFPVVTRESRLNSRKTTCFQCNPKMRWIYLGGPSAIQPGTMQPDRNTPQHQEASLVEISCRCCLSHVPDNSGDWVSEDPVLPPLACHLGGCQTRISAPCTGLAATSHLPVPLMPEILGNVAFRPGNVALSVY